MVVKYLDYAPLASYAPFTIVTWRGVVGGVESGVAVSRNVAGVGYCGGCRWKYGGGRVMWQAWLVMWQVSRDVASVALCGGCRVIWRVSRDVAGVA